MDSGDGSSTTVGILGAGLSGVLMAMQLRRAGVEDFTVYEKLDDVGGTWFRNTYPGLHCDIPAHLYSYSFEPNPDWSMVYAERAEIQRYVRACAERHGVVERLRLGTCVEVARYDEDEACWELETATGERARHRLLVAATGGLTEGRLPKVDGLDRFWGRWWHSADWRHDVDLTGLRVAVVGSAASAVQVVPEVAKVASELVVFSRTPNWVLPRGNRPYDDDERAAARTPEGIRRLRARQYREAMLWYGAFRKHGPSVDEVRRRCLDNLRASIDDPALVEALTPRYDPGCKRILVSDDYYPALAQPHVRLVPRGVRALDEDGVVADDGSRADVDVVIFCTGYRLGGRADGRPALEVLGRGGRRLVTALAERPEAYLGMAIPGFPNYFTVCGINGTVAYGSLIATAELHTEAIARLARRVVDGEVHSIEARPEVAASYNERIQAELQGMSWAGDCPNFYRDRTGRITAFFPGTIGRLRRELRAALDGLDGSFQVGPGPAAAAPA